MRPLVSVSPLHRVNTSLLRWIPEVHGAEALFRSGRHWTSTGQNVGARVFVSVEEALFLLERGATEMLYIDGLPVTLQVSSRCAALCLGGYCD